jgi:hypothetical protein
VKTSDGPRCGASLDETARFKFGEHGHADTWPHCWGNIFVTKRLCRNAPHYSCQIWCADFSAIDLTNKTKDSNGWVNSDKVWTFVHEFGHVWQSTYGPSAWQSALALWLSNNCTGYEKLYAYDLTMSTSLFDYNIEQAASIFADYWSLSNGVMLSNGKNTLYSNNSNPQVSSYSGFISQMQNPPPPPVPQNVEPSDGGAPPGGTS